MERLSLLQRVVLLLAVILVLGLIRNPEPPNAPGNQHRYTPSCGPSRFSSRSNEKNPTRAQSPIQSFLEPKTYRRTVITNHRRSKHLLVVINELHKAALASENDSQRAHPNLVRPTSSTVSHTRISWGNLVNVASTDTTKDLLKNIVVLHYLQDLVSAMSGCGFG